MREVMGIRGTMSQIHCIAAIHKAMNYLFHSTMPLVSSACWLFHHTCASITSSNSHAPWIHVLSVTPVFSRLTCVQPAQSHPCKSISSSQPLTSFPHLFSHFGLCFCPLVWRRNHFNFHEKFKLFTFCDEPSWVHGVRFCVFFSKNCVFSVKRG